MEEKGLYKQINLAVKHFESLEDPRIERTKQYPLIEIIVITLSAILSGADSFYEIALFGKTKQDWLKQFLKLENGVPSHDTYNRVISLLEPANFQACVLEWITAFIGGKLNKEDILSIDGKQLRGSKKTNLKAVHMLNVWSHKHGLCLASTAIESKTNEITAVPELLDTLSLLDLTGCIVTVDALNTQRDIALKVEEHKADYVMALKANQGTLYEDVKWLFNNVYELEEDSFAETHKVNRGRDEYRSCTVISDISYLETHNWPKLNTVAKLVSERKIQGRITREVRYYLSSLEPTAAEFLHIVRSHWEIENKLHWVLDVIFHEDQHSYAKPWGVENMSVLRQLALNLFRQDSSKGSLKGKLKRAAWDDHFRASILNGLTTF